MKLWGKHGKICNMHVERTFASMRHAVRTFSHDAPTISRVVSSGFLSEWLKHHRDAGGSDPNEMTREVLLARGVLLNAARPERSKNPNMIRVNLHYANCKWATEGLDSHETRYQFMARKCEEFSRLPDAEKAHWQELARLSVVVAQSSSDDQAEPVHARDEESLWGLADDGLPIKESLAAEHIRNTLSSLDPDKPLSWSAWGPEFANRFVENMFFKGPGTYPFFLCST